MIRRHERNTIPVVRCILKKYNPCGSLYSEYTVGGDSVGLSVEESVGGSVGLSVGDSVV